MPKPWTAPEENRLRADYPHHTNRKLAEMFGRTMASIHHRAAKLRLAKSPDLTWSAWNRKSGWQPIETAPSDGEIHLRWSRRHGFIVGNAPPGCMPGIWACMDGAWHGHWDSIVSEATHWMPLPEPPK